MFEFFKKRKLQKEFEKKLIGEFLKEHESYIPKYTPKGMKLNWRIGVCPVGEYDIYTGEFKGIYEVVISQIPPSFLRVDNNCYSYNTETKKLEITGFIWA